MYNKNRLRHRKHTAIKVGKRRNIRSMGLTDTNSYVQNWEVVRIHCSPGNYIQYIVTTCNIDSQLMIHGCIFSLLLKGMEKKVNLVWLFSLPFLCKTQSPIWEMEINVEVNNLGLRGIECQLVSMFIKWLLYPYCFVHDNYSNSVCFPLILFVVPLSRSRDLLQRNLMLPQGY